MTRCCGVKSSTAALLLVALLLTPSSLLAAAETTKKKATSPPPFFIQDPNDSMCLGGEEFKRCSLDTLFYVLGEPGSFQIHKRAPDGSVDELDDGMCISKKSCKEGDAGKTMDLKLAKCSHCGSKKWNILGDSNTGYIFTEDDGKTCLMRKKDSTKAMTAPCDLNDTENSDVTPFMLQFASQSDITSMSSPGARLVSAASDGDKKAVQALLKSGIDINFRDWDKLTALIPAASNGNLDLAKFLVKEGIDVNAADKDGITALMEAAIMGHLKVVEFLVDNGAQVDAKAGSGVTSLWLAGSEGKTDVMKYLISKGADASNTRSDGITAVMTASMSGHVDAVRLLLENGADPVAGDSSGVTPLHAAAESGAIDVVKLLVDKKKDDLEYLNAMSEQGFTAMVIASAQGHVEVVEYLLQHGADPNKAAENQVTALMYAASHNHTKVVQVLLDKAHVQIDDKHTNQGTALLEAATSGSPDTLALLIEKGASFDFADADGVTPLMAVGSQKNLESQQIVLDAIKNKYSGQELTDYINQFSFSGGSAVMFAAAGGNAGLVKQLLEIGANVHAVAQATPEYLEKLEKMAAEGTVQPEEPHVDGLTAIHVAAQGGHMETAEILLEQKVNVNVKDEQGRSPLILAIKGNHGEMARLLVRNGADPNESFVDDKDVSHNLLFDAIMVENEGFATDLIQNGADLYYKDEKGVTTLLQACHRGLTDIAKLLLEKHQENGPTAAPSYLDEPSDEGITPLVAAASEGHLAVAKLLLQAKANVDAKDKDGTNALMAASARGHLEIVKALLEAGAKINEQNSDGHTALMFAYNGKNQVETLWERYSNFANSQQEEATSPEADDGGTGPIIKDALSNHTALVDLLIKAGADIKLKDKEGHIAKDFDYHPDTDEKIIEKEAKVEQARMDETRSEL